jgi:hypothetical protein
MTGTKYKLRDYLNYIKMSKKKHLLVEGITDKRSFKLLVDELQKKINVNLEFIEIDTAESLSFHDVPRNCDRIERICQSIQDEDYSQKLVGFVDREFREFEYNSFFEDKLDKHNVQGRLVWSRGHSIENYFFDYGILSESFRDLVVIDCFDEALKIFKQVIESTIKIACSVSIASEKLKKNKRIEPTISWQIIQIDSPNKISIKLVEWEEKLVNQHNFIPQDAHIFCEEYTSCQARVSSFQNIQVLRWLCHGHLGIEFLWAVYVLCIDRVGSQKQGSKCQVDKQLKTHNCASWWARKAVNGDCDYPKEVFQLFGIDI